MVNGALGARAVTSVVPCPEGGRESKLPHAVIVSGTTREKPENYELGSESCIKEMQLSS